MNQVLRPFVLLVLGLALAACGSSRGAVTPGPDVRAEGSPEYFFRLLSSADATADYIVQATSLADLLPNRTHRVLAATPGGRAHSFSWTDRVVVGRVTGVRNAEQNRTLRLTIEVEESFPASAGKTLVIDLPGYPEYANQYQVSASSLDLVVLGITDEFGSPQVARAAQFIGTVDAEDRISWPLLSADEFAKSPWDDGMTTLAGLRDEAAASASTITYRR